jgi:hypothetical protein
LANDTKTPTEALVAECLDQSRNCLYASTNFFLWLKVLRGLRLTFVVVPLVFGSLATWTLLTTSDNAPLRLFVAVLAFLAGLLPTVYRALKFDDNVGLCAKLAAEFKNLQDRFRQCATVSSLKPYAEFEAEFRRLMTRLEKARRPSYTPPEWCFKRAQKKVQSGDYDPDPQPGR